MNRQDIIKLAQEAGISESHAQGMQGFLERFAALVAAAFFCWLVIFSGSIRGLVQPL